MSLASSRQSFLLNVLTSYSHGPRNKPILLVNPISCKQPSDDTQDSSRRNENRVAKLAMVALAAGVLTLGSVDDAFAANSGGRVGGQAFKSSAPRPSGPRSNNSRTNIYINPSVAPPLVGGYGYGYGYGVPYYGGWGWLPFSFFAPGPSVAIGIGGGFETLSLFVFLGAVAAVVRRFASLRDEEDDY